MKNQGRLVLAAALLVLQACGGSGNGNNPPPDGDGGDGPTGPVWSTMTPMPTPRLEFATASAGGLVYVIGGRDALASITPKPQVATMEVYDPATDTWSTGPDLPIAASGMMAVGAGSKIYALGGDVLNTFASNALYEFDPATQTWLQLADMPESRYFSAAAQVNGQVLVAGGRSGGFEVASLYRYDIAADTWTVGTPMSEVRAGAKGTGVDGQFLVYGGETATYPLDAGYRRLLESYDPVMDLWTTLDPGEPRRDFGAAVVNGIVYTFGGNNVARSLDMVRSYDTQANAWDVKTALPAALSFVQAEVAGDEILVFSTQDTLLYSPANDPM
jgi:N-acetylneuraminic acid mutarotase